MSAHESALCSRVAKAAPCCRAHCPAQRLVMALLLLQGELAEERRAAQGGRGADVAPHRPAAEAHVRPRVAQRHAGQRQAALTVPSLQQQT